MRPAETAPAITPDIVNTPDGARQALVFRLPVIKGVCVLAVILTHATASIWRPFAWPLVPEVFANTLARFAVPLFIAMSGFYLSLNTRNERALRFYRRTLPGLVRPFVVYTTVYILVGNPDVAHLLRTGPGHLLHGSASAHLWFIPIIIELYLVHPILRRSYSRSARPGRLASVAVAVQVGYMLVYEVVVRPGGPLVGWGDLIVTCTSCLKFIGYFVLGYVLRDNASAILESFRRSGAFWAATAVWLVTGAILPVAQASQVPGCCPALWAVSSRIALDLLAIPLTIAAFGMMVAWRPGWRAPSPVRWGVRACGLYSYGVYYLHPLVLFVVARMLYRYAGPLMVQGPLRAAVLFLLNVVIAVYAVKLLARLPLARYLA